MSDLQDPQRFDVLVLGSGIAGLFYALRVAEHGSVGVVTKRRSQDSATDWAQGGIAAVLSPEDSFETHVADTVKRETGFSVGEWLTAGRVAEAAARLTHTDESLDTVAERVGWRDKTHFIRQFKKAHGVTPAAFRRAKRAAHMTPPTDPE